MLRRSALASPDEAKKACVVRQQEAQRREKGEAADDQVRDAQEQVLAAHPRVGAQHDRLRKRGAVQT